MYDCHEARLWKHPIFIEIRKDIFNSYVANFLFLLNIHEHLENLENLLNIHESLENLNTARK